MTENTILLKARAWGCKIKSNIQGELVLSPTELKQGEGLNIKFNINFDPDDLPESIEVSQENKQGIGFTLPALIPQKVSEAAVEVDIPLEYVDAKPGEYRIEINFRHAEYGTLIADVSPINFQLITPQVEIAYCRPDKTNISRGQEVNIEVGINSPAPQKIRGIVFGRLTGPSHLVHKLYELEPKRISILGDREVNWHLRIPADESETGKLKAVIEFKSKDSFSKKEFDRLLELRASRALRVISIKGSASEVSSGDELVLNAELENIGLEDMDFEVFPEIILKALRKRIQKQKAPVDRKVDKKLQETGTTEEEIEEFVELEGDEDYKAQRWVLPTRSLKLASDKSEQLKWSWRLPENIPTGKYQVTIHWTDLTANKSAKYSQELFEVKKHHEVRILNAILVRESFSAGDEAGIKIILSDKGTRTNDSLVVDCRVFDILSQEVFRSSNKIKITEAGTEFDLLWSIPMKQDSGKYDLEVQVLSGDQNLGSRRFSKILNIELPVKLDIHLIMPSTIKEDLEIIPYLLETEEITNKIKHQTLAIYRLNSNTHLYKSNDELIKYSIDEKSTPGKLQIFGDGLLSYLVTRRYLNQKSIKSELDYWYKLGYSWSNMMLGGEQFLDVKGIAKLKKICSKGPTIAVCEEISQTIFRNGSPSSSQKRAGTAGLNDVLKEKALKDKGLSKTDELKLITLVLKFFSELDTKGDSLESKPKHQLKAKKSANNLQLIYELNSTLLNSVKFRKKVNSHLLQKKFNQILTKWLYDVRKSRIKRNPSNDKWLVIRTAYSYLFTYLIREIISILRTISREKSIAPANFCKLSLLEISYYFSLMNYYKSEAKYNPYLMGDQANQQLNFAFGEIKKQVMIFWSMHKSWQMRCSNYLKNMSKRANLAYVREHVKITTNPVILHGLRGMQSRIKLILGNDGSRRITLQSNLALPSIHWNLLEPEAMAVNDMYQLKRMQIASKQTKELPINISFPQSLSFPKYTGILKLNAKPITLLPEID